MIEAIKAGRIEVVRGVESLDATGVRLADGERVAPEVVICATGYRRGLKPLAGHLGPREQGVPRSVFASSCPSSPCSPATSLALETTSVLGEWTSSGDASTAWVDMRAPSAWRIDPPSLAQASGVESEGQVRARCAPMDAATIRAMLEQHFEYARNDPEHGHAMYTEDAVLEFPQSGERFVGVENLRVWRSNYPANTSFECREVRGRDDFWVAELSISYDGGPANFGVSILELRGDKIARESIYVTEGFAPPQWRAQWRTAP